MYIPNDAVMAYVRQVDFVGVVGPTAAGKSTLIARAMERDPALHLVRSTTSRPPRPGERDGVDMHFRSKQEMQGRRQARDYVTALELFANIYATAPEDYTEQGVSVLPMAAEAAPLFQVLPFHSYRVVFVLPPSYEVWHERIAGRATNELDKRMAEAAKSLQFALNTADVVFVLNDDLDIAAESFVDMLHGHPADAAQQAACRELAVALLQRVRA